MVVVASAITCGKIAVSPRSKTFHLPQTLASAVSKLCRAQGNLLVWTPTGSVVCHANLGLG